ncbi:inhibitor of nuclear factor kappa-B kinase-interacting protein isoform X2 [Anguilla anguilla]|uniref:inhibitor of nuclear factor kappa-B kinase-interacting protein isoform X2 n=1 Tax=Anguilla anguilla TaxID=7936 RepID=UPI0015A82F8F|nr:inhibitor of nuclear factor kappa-B kinase-interacting protein isoform X2 [Anguilla anguilla]
MPSNELKQRKKTPQGKQDDKSDDTSKPTAKEDEAKKADVTEGKLCAGERPTSQTLDLRTIACLLSIAVCLSLSWVVLQQNIKFAEVEEKYKLLYQKTAVLQELENEIGQITRKFKGVQVLVEKLEGQSVLSHVENLDRDVSQLKEWVSGLTEKREKLQENLSGLSQAVRGIEERTTVITQDVSAKVASVRTDVRRMAGLESEVEALLASEQELEEKVAHAERAMVKRIGDVLASSIDRVTVLKSSTDRNGQSLERLRRQLAELSAADAALAGRLQTLESGRARLLKTVTFASDLKPKVSTIKKDFALLEPQMADLTLRIGRLAEDMMRREEDIAVLRETLANLTAVQGDLRSVQQQLTQVPNISDVFPQTNEPGE